MKNQQIKIDSQQNTATISQLQSLNLEQLNDVAGGGYKLKPVIIRSYDISGRA